MNERDHHSGGPGPASDLAPRPTVPSPFTRLDLRGKRALLIASTGGHAAQLSIIARAGEVHPDSVFVTFPGVQAADFARDYRVVEVPYIPPRGWRGTFRSFGPLAALLRRQAFDIAVSTGAAVAVPGLTLARMHGIRAVYVESYTRYRRPSVTGSVLQWVPGVETFSQHEGWQRPWAFDGSVLGVLEQAPPVVSPGRARKVFVTVGTIRPYRFDTVIDRIAAMLPDDVEATWQVGATTRHDLRGEVHEAMSTSDFERTILESDIVVSHGGTGTILKLLALGKRPILVPRRSARAEHVDDHQLEVCHDFARRGLAIVREVEALSQRDFGWDDASSVAS